MTDVPVSVTSGSRYFSYYAFLWGMKNIVMLMLLLLTSCGLKQVDMEIHSGSDGVWRGPSYGKHMSGTCYALGLDYPKGYDWKSGQSNDETECDVVMFADGIPVLRVKAGDEYEVSTDILRHRIRDGKLYSDYTDGITTVIKEDGKEVVRFDDVEEILCLEPSSGRLHTIGLPVGGNGFVYRVDGECLIRKDSATIYPHLDEYGGHLSFCFSSTVRDAAGYRPGYYQVTDGIVKKVDVDSAVMRVWDMRVVEGELYIAASLPDKAPVLLWGEAQESVAYLNALDMVSCTFCGTRTVCLNCRFHHSGSDLMSDILWMGGDDWKMYRLGSTLSSVYVDKDGFGAVINPANGRDGLIFDAGKAYHIPEGYAVSSKDCMIRKDGVLYVGLTSNAGGGPVIWNHDGIDTLRINGPLFCLR